MKTIAQQCATDPEPYRTAVEKSLYRGHPSSDRKVFHFEDGSYLWFEVTYKPAETGVSQPCGRPNTI